MKTSFKKVLVTGLSITGALLLAACGNDAEEGAVVDPAEEITEDSIGTTGAMEGFDVGDTFVATEPLEISMLYRDMPAYPYDADWMFFNVLDEDHNVSFDIMQAPLSDFEERRSVTISAGDMPDIVSDTWIGHEKEFVPSGALLAVSDYVHFMPHFQNRIEEWDLQEQIDNARYSDGKYYVLPGLNEHSHFDFSFKYNKTVFDELGIEEPSTYDELRTALETLKEETGETPMTLWWQGNAMFNFVGAQFDTIGGWGFINGAMYDEANDEFVYAPTESGYREMVEYFAGLVEDGLLHAEAFTQDGEMTRNQLVNQEAFVSTGQELTLNDVNNGLREMHGEGVYEFERMQMLEGPAGKKVDGGNTNSGYVLSSNLAERDDFLAVLQFLDWLLYSDEGNMYAQWGVEGETYEATDEFAGGYKPLDHISYESFNTDQDESLQEDYGFANAAFMFASNAEIQYSRMSGAEIDFQSSTNEEFDVNLPDPPYPMSQADQEEAALLSTPLQDTTEQYTLRFITGQLPLSEWDTFMAELESQNVDRFMDMVNSSYRDFQEALEEAEE